VANLKLSARSEVSSASNWRSQLESALIGLGFTARDANLAIEELANDLGSKVDELDIGKLLKLALQNQGRK